jgi:uncharacterized protein (TIGR03437 family)
MMRDNVWTHRPLAARLALGMLSASLLPGLALAQMQYTISSVAGNGTSGFSGDGGPATSAQLASPVGIAVDASHNLYIADQLNHRLRKVSNGTISTVAGSGTAGFTGDGSSATAADLNSPLGVVVDSSGDIYIADTVNDVIRKVSGGNISTPVGNYGAGYGDGGDGSPPASAIFYYPVAVALDSAGNLYISDLKNDRVRKVTWNANVINTIAGNGSLGYSGDGLKGPLARLNSPYGLAVDAQGNVYIADSDNNVVRKVDTNGIISTVAGNGTAGFSGDGKAAVNAQLSRPYAVAVDAAGNLYIADYYNKRIRRVDTNGIITTIAGNGHFGDSGDGGPATSAALGYPSGLAVDTDGTIYISDPQNDVIRMLTPAAAPPAISSGGVISAGAFGAFSSIAPGSWIEIYGQNLAGSTRTWMTSDFNGNAAPTSLDGVSVTVGGQAAFIDYVSPTQIDAQVPSNIGSGPQQVVVTTPQGSTQPDSITVNTTQAGLYAPPSLSVGGKQYVGAFLQDGTYVLPSGAVSGINSMPAKPGDTITLYGIGFGSVTPEIPAGQIVGANNMLTSQLQILFGQTAATISYEGLAPGFVGLYQFNVVVPNVGASDAVPLTFTLGSVPGTQTLYTAVGN